MVFAVHRLEPSQRQVRVNLRCGYVCVAQNQLHAAQVGAMLHHVGGATVAQPVRAGCVVSYLYQVPDPLARERHAPE
jgi:hypothetical protein